VTPDLVTLFVSGGLSVGLLVLLALLHLAVAAAQVVAPRRVDLVPLLWAMVLLTVLGGAFAAQFAYMEACTAVAMASADAKHLLLAAGTAEAWRKLAAAALLAMGQALVTGVAHSVRASASLSGTSAESSLPSG